MSDQVNPVDQMMVYKRITLTALQPHLLAIDAEVGGSNKPLIFAFLSLAECFALGTDPKQPVHPDNLKWWQDVMEDFLGRARQMASNDSKN
jgi:hypothetical protein